MKAKLLYDYIDYGTGNDLGNKTILTYRGSVVEIDSIKRDDCYQGKFKIHVIKGLPDSPTWLSIYWIIPAGDDED